MSIRRIAVDSRGSRLPDENRKGLMGAPRVGGNREEERARPRSTSERGRRRATRPRMVVGRSDSPVRARPLSFFRRELIALRERPGCRGARCPASCRARSERPEVASWRSQRQLRVVRAGPRRARSGLDPSKSGLQRSRRLPSLRILPSPCQDVPPRCARQEEMPRSRPAYPR